MPNFGLGDAISRAVRAGAREAKVLRPAEEELLARQATQAPAPEIPDVALTPPTPDSGAPDLGSAEAPVVPDVTVAVDGAPNPPPQAPNAPVAPVEPLTPDAHTRIASDAFGMNHAQLGDFNPDETFQPNFDRITTTDDIKAVIARQAQQNASKIDEARRGTITNEELKGLAGDLDVNEDVVKKIMTRETGGSLNAETILAARQVLNSSAARLKALADKIVAGGATDLEKVQFARQVQFHNEYQAQFMGARSEAGRALNAFNIPVGSDANQIGRMAEILQNTGADVERVAKAVSLTDSTAGVTKVVRPGLFLRSLKAGQGFLNHIFVNGILSGPVTHITNAMGNVLFQAMNTGELALAARLGRFMPGSEHVQVGEALASLSGAINGTKDAFRLAGRALKTGKTLDDVLKYEGSAPAAGVLGQLPELDKPYLGKVIQGIEAGIGVPTRLLGASDELFKTIAYRSYMERQALLHVQDQVANGKASLANASQVARDFLENAPEETQKAAEDWARDVTFQTPLGPTGQKAQAFLRSVPVLTLIAPFVRTPVNIFKQSVARSPTALLSPKFWNDVKAGGAARDLALTKFAVGSATSALIAKLVAEGAITGSGPQQPEAKMLWEANGRRPYSIRVKDPVTGDETWHSYARAEPLASVLGATADTVEILSYINSDTPDGPQTDEQQHAYDAAGAIIAGIMNNTGNKTFMKGLSDFIELTNDPTRNIKSWSNQMGAALLVPYSAAARSVRNIEDPYLREAWTLNDKIKDNLPGYSKDLPPRLGLFGEMREKNSSSLLGTMSPFPESPQKYDAVYQELGDLMQQTREVPVNMPVKRIDGMRLNAQEYADYTRIARSEPIFGDKKTFRDVLEQTINSSVYQRAEPMMRVEMLKRVQSQADAIARAPNGPLERANQDYADRISQWRLEQNRLRFGK